MLFTESSRFQFLHEFNLVVTAAQSTSTPRYTRIDVVMAAKLSLLCSSPFAGFYQMKPDDG